MTYFSPHVSGYFRIPTIFQNADQEVGGGHDYEEGKNVKLWKGKGEERRDNIREGNGDLEDKEINAPPSSPPNILEWSPERLKEGKRKRKNLVQKDSKSQRVSSRDLTSEDLFSYSKRYLFQKYTYIKASRARSN